ncbi:MAG: hypothetical protein HYW50_00875 [Candidatus Diapherotrites archaeon]|nr:hypothetical protein [Candidatus Diapherotrites archaeon]
MGDNCSRSFKKHKAKGTRKLGTVAASTTANIVDGTKGTRPGKEKRKMPKTRK